MCKDNIRLYFYDEYKDISLGDTVIVFRVRSGSLVGEKATFVKITERFVVFKTASGSEIKVYGTHGYYLGHFPSKPWKDAGWQVCFNTDREVEYEKAQYLKWEEKECKYVWKTK